MGILSKIFDKVLHPGRASAGGIGSPAKAAPAPQAQARPAAPAQPRPAQAAPAAQARPAAPAQPQAAAVDVEAVLSQMAQAKGAELNWRQSIVDQLKLLDIDSSLDARKELAQELGYKGELNGSAEMNIWLQKAVMKQLAANGGKVPANLQD
jgi:hypothetical protein